jgi:hypothetical protein
MILEETTRIRASPETVYRFFEAMEANYERWHPDHVAFRWVDGGGLEPGAEAYFEERIAGKPQAKTVRFVELVPGRYIEFEPTSRLIRLLMPSISFAIEPREEDCDLTQRIRVRTGPIGARLNRREFDAVRAHMREEGQNLKRILEAESEAVSAA